MENEIKQEPEKQVRQYYGSAFILKPKEGTAKKGTDMEWPAYSMVIDVDKVASLKEDESGYIHLTLREREKQEDNKPTHSVVETYLKKDGTYDDMFSCKDIVIKKSEIERLALCEKYNDKEIKSAYLFIAPSGSIFASKSKYADMSQEETYVRGRAYEPGRSFKDIICGWGWTNAQKDSNGEYMNITFDVANALQVRPDEKGMLHFCIHKKEQDENSSKPDLRVVANRKYINNTTDIETIKDIVIPQQVLQNQEIGIDFKLEISGKPEEIRKQVFVTVDPNGIVMYNNLKYPGMDNRVINGAATYKVDKDKNIENMHKEVSERHEKRRTFKI